MRTRVEADFANLESHGRGTQSLSWWGTMAFMALEGMGFVLGIGVFLYLAWLNPEWPLGYPPQDLLFSTSLTVFLIVSLIPNAIVLRKAKENDNKALKPLLVLMSLIGVVALVLRVFEFTRLSMRWDDNVYGSLLWVLLGLHTTHLATDVADTIYMTVLFFTRHTPETRFIDADENAFYWIFVVVAWLPLYGLLYWAPRIGGG
jgi:cytochrome c oxidase subunit 3